MNFVANAGRHNYYSGNINFNNSEIPWFYPLSILIKVDRRQGKALVSDEVDGWEVDCFAAENVS